MATIPLALLPDRAVTASSVTIRCNVQPNPTGGPKQVTTATGDKVQCSVQFVCRPEAAPTVGESLTVKGTTCAVVKASEQDSVGPWLRHTIVYCATRTDITGPLDTTVTVYPSETSTDAYGSVVRVPSATGTSMAARLEPVTSSESHTDGQRRDQTWRLVVDDDLLAIGVDAYAQVVDADGLVWALVGDPLVHTDATGEKWSEVKVRRTGDGAA